MTSGRFISFEGGEGAGKSTQAGRLAMRLRDAGLEIVLTREPGGSPLAEAIRDLLLDPKRSDRNPLSEALLFAAARADHLDALIRPVLARGGWVLCDRFTDSTRAYQGSAGGLPIASIDMLERLVVGSTWPDLTIMLDLPAAMGLERARERQKLHAAALADAFEARSLAYHEALRRSYLAIAARDPARCVVVDATRAADVTEAQVWQVVSQRLDV